MAIRKLKPANTDEQRRIRDRADRARRQSPPQDPSGQHHASCADIARAAGLDVSDVLDTWSERAAVRRYDGCADHAEAERLAVDDVRRIYPPKQKGLDV